MSINIKSRLDIWPLTRLISRVGKDPNVQLWMGPSLLTKDIRLIGVARVLAEQKVCLFVPVPARHRAASGNLGINHQ